MSFKDKKRVSNVHIFEPGGEGTGAGYRKEIAFIPGTAISGVYETTKRNITRLVVEQLLYSLC